MTIRTQSYITIMYEKAEAKTAVIEVAKLKKEKYRVKDYQVATDHEKGFYILAKTRVS